MRQILLRFSTLGKVVGVLTGALLVSAAAAQLIFRNSFEGYWLSYQFDESAAQSAMIGTGGGSVDLLDVGPGVQVNLTIPGAALLDDQVITVTPATDIMDLPAGFHPLFAVRLDPEAQPLGAPAELTFTIPQHLRPGEKAVGFFTGGDGSDLFLLPLTAADGSLTADADGIVSIRKTGFSAGGAATVDDDFSNIVQNPEQKLADILRNAVNCSALGCGGPDGGFSESDIQAALAVMNEWNADLRVRLARLFEDLRQNGVTERNKEDLLGVIAEQKMLEGYLQKFSIDPGDVDNLLAEPELESALEQFINESYDLCATTDTQQAEQSETMRLELASLLQLLEVNTPFQPGDQFCYYNLELVPQFTELESPLEAAVVQLLMRVFNPRAAEITVQVPGATFSAPAALLLEPSSNVSLGVYNPGGSELRFLVEDTEIGSVTVRGEPGARVINSATAEAQIVSRFGGAYTAEWEATQAGCTDPEDEGAQSGTIDITLSASILSVSESRVVHRLTGSGGGAGLTMTIRENLGSTSASVIGSATYTGSSTEFVTIDDVVYLCTYTADSSGDLGGSVSFGGSQVVIDVTGSNIEASYSGSPSICGSGSCSAVTGGAVFTRSSPP